MDEEAVPKHARCVYRGSKFSVWEWEQELFDGTKKIFDRVVYNNGIIVIPVVGDKILLQHEEQPGYKPFLSLPAGVQEDDGEPVDTAKRELIEESGYVSENWILWKEFFKRSSIYWHDFIYIAKDCKKVAEPTLEAGEKITTELISFEQFFDLIDNPDFRLREIALELCKLKLHPERLAEFKKLLFE